MSSRGMTRAQLEARRRELERQRELARQQRVKSQVMETIKHWRKNRSNLLLVAKGMVTRKNSQKLLRP